MADDEPVFTSLKDRIAALNLQQGGAPAPKGGPPKPKPKVAPKPVPPRDPSPISAVSTASTSSWKPPTPAASTPSWRPPTPSASSASPWKPPTPSTSSTPSKATPSTATSWKPPTAPRPALPPSKPPLPSKAGLRPPAPDEEEPARSPPPLPGRGGARPPLPVRKSSEPALARRLSAEPVARRLPPSVPGGRPGDDADHDHGSAPALRPRPPLPGKPGLPPRLPSRQDEHDDSTSASPPTIPSKPAPGIPRRTLPPSVPRSTSPPPSQPSNGPPHVPLHSRPPPVPLASRPRTEPTPAARPAAPAAPPAAEGPIDMPPITCLVCRDFTQPDEIASRYPRQSLPRDPVNYLADVLCSPFEYLADKARAIFTWCHYNIEYDVANFLAGTIPRGHTAEDTIHTGKGVCEGFAHVYQAVAEAAGLECIRIGGHGKGFGYKSPGAGVVPPFDYNHAWNAVRLDDGRWKLVDACWGAGSLTNGAWEQVLKPVHFTMSNDAFGLAHYPKDPAEQFRDDGREMTWEEYIGDGADAPTIYTSAHAEGLDPTGLEPASRYLDPHALAQAGLVRFQVPWVCDHWADNVVARKGGPMLLMVHTGDDNIPMDYNGEWWYADIPVGKIRGDTSIYALDTVNGEDARGMTKDEFLRRKGRIAYSFVGMVQYEAV